MRAILLTLGLISSTCFAVDLYSDPTVTDPENFEMSKISDLHWNKAKPDAVLTMNNGKLMLSSKADSNYSCRIDGFKGEFYNHTGFYQFNENKCHIVVTLDPSVANNNKITYSSTVRFSSESNPEACRSYCQVEGGIHTLEGRYR